MSLRVADVTGWLAQFAPLDLAETWDAVGLLVGDESLPVRRVSTCLTVTQAVIDEAAAWGAELIVSHHPCPFQPLKTVTTATPTGRLVWQAARAGISIYSPHTAFDGAPRGINQRIAEGIGLVDVRPLIPRPDGRGAGRRGTLPQPESLAAVVARLKGFFKVEVVELAGPQDRLIQTVAVGCGSGASFLSAAQKAGADLLVSGEARFHALLEAEDLGVTLALVGHYASERFAVEALAQELAAAFPSLEVRPSAQEADPLHRG